MHRRLIQHSTNCLQADICLIERRIVAREPLEKKECLNFFCGIVLFAIPGDQNPDKETNRMDASSNSFSGIRQRHLGLSWIKKEADIVEESPR